MKGFFDKGMRKQHHYLYTYEIYVIVLQTRIESVGKKSDKKFLCFFFYLYLFGKREMEKKNTRK